MRSKKIESMKAKVVEIKKKTKSCQEKTLEKLDELHKILQKDVQNSEESTVLVIDDVKLGG